MNDVSGLVDQGAVAQARAEAAAAAAAAEKKKPEEKKKVTGLKRELYALLQDESLPAVLPAKKPVPTSFRDRKKGGVKWEWKPFTSSARAPDKAKLSHWWKKHENPDDYSFARFNKKPKIIAYQMGAAENADYQAHCRNDHVGRPTNWSKAETDQLVKLCQRYEMRWHVIFDRWEPVKGAKHQRSLEDMKERYYGIAKSIDQSLLPHQFLADEHSERQVRRVVGYDAKYERERKLKLHNYYTYNAAQEESDVAITQKAAAIDETKQQREQELSDSGNVGADWIGSMGSSDVAALEMCNEALSTHLGGSLKRAVVARRKILPQQPECCNKTGDDQAANTPGVAGRASRRATAVDTALAEIGIDTTDPEYFQEQSGVQPGLPLMPIIGVQANLYILRGHLRTYFELQNAVQAGEDHLVKLKQQKLGLQRGIQQAELQAKKGAAAAGAPPAGAPPAAAPPAAAPTPMALDPAPAAAAAPGEPGGEPAGPPPPGEPGGEPAGPPPP